MTSATPATRAAEAPPGSSGRFAFGRNWRRFLSTLNEERLGIAERELCRMLAVEDLREKTFLDIGSGSGIHSLAAVRLGARVTSFDYDVDSVGCTEEVRQRFGGEADWRIEQGSVLDAQWMTKLGTYDVVYSWGVLHHTGRMWEAIGNAAGAVAPGGRFFLAIYNDQGGASRRWLAIKRAYNGSPPPVRALLLVAIGLWFEGRASLVALARFRNPLPFKRWSEYKRLRGMSVWHNLVDWVGGYPFEVARPEQVLARLRPRGFVLLQMTTCAGGHGCNEFLFRLTGSEQEQKENN